MSITRRERDVLQPAVIHRWRVEYDWRGNARWEGDSILPFRAHKTLAGLVGRGLMVCVGGNHYHATPAGRAYACKAPGCHQGKCYAESESGYDEPVGDCPACDGTGLKLDVAISEIGCNLAL